MKLTFLTIILLFSTSYTFAQVRISFSQEINPKSTQRLIDQIQEGLNSLKDSHLKVITITVNSPGGDIEHARKLVRFIKSFNERSDIFINTQLSRRRDSCDSSCTILFTAGKARSAHIKSRFGFHSPRYQRGAPRGMNRRDIEERYRQIWLSYIEAVDEQTASVIEAGGYLNRDAMRYLSAEDLYPGYVTELLR